MTKNGANLMQFHSGSSNMVPLRLYLIEALVGSSLAGMTGEAATSQEKSDAKDQQGRLRFDPVGS